MECRGLFGTDEIRLAASQTGDQTFLLLRRPKGENIMVGILPRGCSPTQHSAGSCAEEVTDCIATFIIAARKDGAVSQHDARPIRLRTSGGSRIVSVKRPFAMWVVLEAATHNWGLLNPEAQPVFSGTACR